MWSSTRTSIFALVHLGTSTTIWKIFCRKRCIRLDLLVLTVHRYIMQFQRIQLYFMTYGFNTWKCNLHNAPSKCMQGNLNNHYDKAPYDNYQIWWPLTSRFQHDIFTVIAKATALANEVILMQLKHITIFPVYYIKLYLVFICIHRYVMEWRDVLPFGIFCRRNKACQIDLIFDWMWLRIWMW